MSKSRVNYRYESNKRIFQVDPGRQFARDRVYAQLASLQALGVLAEKQLGVENFILIEEDRGEENSYIGGHKKGALPVFFMNLRDYLLE